MEDVALLQSDCRSKLDGQFKECPVSPIRTTYHIRGLRERRLLERQTIRTTAKTKRRFSNKCVCVIESENLFDLMNSKVFRMTAQFPLDPQPSYRCLSSSSCHPCLLFIRLERCSDRGWEPLAASRVSSSS